MELVPSGQRVIAAIALGEMFNVMVRKGRFTRQQAVEAVAYWSAGCWVTEVRAELIGRAAEVAARHQLQIWDAVHMVGAAEAGCDYLLSEDMQDGFSWGRLTVVNPFDDARWEWLRARF